MIGGNITAVIQTKTVKKNEIGESVKEWSDCGTLRGFLDLSSGDSTNTYNAKLQDSTHIFLCDYQSLDFTSSDARMIINDSVYNIQLIDDPMGLHQHLEIYLKYVGGGVNV